MSLWRDDQNEDVQLVMEKGAQVLNVGVKMVFFGLSLTEHILNSSLPLPFFFFSHMTEIDYNRPNPEVFLQFLHCFNYRFIVNSKEVDC